MGIKRWAERFFLWFLLAQPTLDLLTTFSIVQLHTSATVGMAVRMITLVLGLAYLVVYAQRAVRLYLSILFLCVLVGLVDNLLVKHPLDLFLEVKFIAKSLYFIVMLFVYLTVFRTTRENWQKEVPRFIYVAMSIIGIVMLVSVVTDTGLPSYTYGKEGEQGWFYAANELGVIMGSASFVAAYYAFRKTDSLSKIYYWLPVGLIVFSLLVLGTKVGYGAALILLLVSCAIALFYGVKEKRWQHGLAAFVFLVAFVWATPFSPTAHNMNLFVDTGRHGSLAHTEPSENGSISLLSDRDLFLRQQAGEFQKAGWMQKLFGMGYAGNYENVPKIIEMDFYDLFFSYGILGCLLYVLPLIWLGWNLLFSFIKDFRKRLNPETIFFGCGIGLAFGVSALAGHVLFAPAVGIYLAVMVAYLTVRWRVI